MLALATAVMLTQAPQGAWLPPESCLSQKLVDTALASATSLDADVKQVISLQEELWRSGERDEADALQLPLSSLQGLVTYLLFSKSMADVGAVATKGSDARKAARRYLGWSLAAVERFSGDDVSMTPALFRRVFARSKSPGVALEAKTCISNLEQMRKALGDCLPPAPSK